MTENRRQIQLKGKEMKLHPYGCSSGSKTDSVAAKFSASCDSDRYRFIFRVIQSIRPHRRFPDVDGGGRWLPPWESGGERMRGQRDRERQLNFRESIPTSTKKEN